MLELRSVSKRYGGTLAVNGVSFLARAGEITGYLGPNGSGKSTTIKMIAGLIEATAGDIALDGVPIDRHPLVWKQRLGYVPEEPHLYAHLSALEYLVRFGQLRDLPVAATTERVEGMLALLGLALRRRGGRARAAQPDPGAGQAGEGRTVQFTRARHR
jgi:ABC-2 type transport system ATP-binding protein